MSQSFKRIFTEEEIKMIADYLSDPKNQEKILEDFRKNSKDAKLIPISKK